MNNYKFLQKFQLVLMFSVIVGCSQHSSPVVKRDAVYDSSIPARSDAVKIPGVQFRIMDVNLQETLEISHVALIQGDYVKQLQFTISNIGNDAQSFYTEPKWKKNTGAIISTRFSQRTLHLLQPGESKSLDHQGINSEAVNVEIEVTPKGQF